MNDQKFGKRLAAIVNAVGWGKDTQVCGYEKKDLHFYLRGKRVAWIDWTSIPEVPATEGSPQDQQPG